MKLIKEIFLSIIISLFISSAGNILLAQSSKVSRKNNTGDAFKVKPGEISKMIYNYLQEKKSSDTTNVIFFLDRSLCASCAGAQMVMITNLLEKLSPRIPKYGMVMGMRSKNGAKEFVKSIMVNLTDVDYDKNSDVYNNLINSKGTSFISLWGRNGRLLSFRSLSPGNSIEEGWVNQMFSEAKEVRKKTEISNQRELLHSAKNIVLRTFDSLLIKTGKPLYNPKFMDYTQEKNLISISDYINNEHRIFSLADRKEVAGMKFDSEQISLFIKPYLRDLFWREEYPYARAKLHSFDSKFSNNGDTLYVAVELPEIKFTIANNDTAEIIDSRYALLKFSLQNKLSSIIPFTYKDGGHLIDTHSITMNPQYLFYNRPQKEFMIGVTNLTDEREDFYNSELPAFLLVDQAARIRNKLGVLPSVYSQLKIGYNFAGVVATFDAHGKCFWTFAFSSDIYMDNDPVIPLCTDITARFSSMPQPMSDSLDRVSELNRIGSAITQIPRSIFLCNSDSLVCVVWQKYKDDYPYSIQVYDRYNAKYIGYAQIPMLKEEEIFGVFLSVTAGKNIVNVLKQKEEGGDISLMRYVLDLSVSTD